MSAVTLLHTPLVSVQFSSVFWWFLHSIEAENKQDLVLAERRHGPLLDICGALWVLLQGLHDLTVVQHESHELVFPLRLGRRAVDWSDQLQLLQVLEGLRTSGIRSEHEGTPSIHFYSVS